MRHSDLKRNTRLALRVGRSTGFSGRLFKMVALKNATDNPASHAFCADSCAREYTKLDSLLDIVTFVAQDVSEEEAEENSKLGRESREGAYVSKLDRAELRAQAKDFFLRRLKQDTRDISRTLLETQDAAPRSFTHPLGVQRIHYVILFGLQDTKFEFVPSMVSLHRCLCAMRDVLCLVRSRVIGQCWFIEGQAALRHIVLRLQKDGSENRLRHHLGGDSKVSQTRRSEHLVECLRGSQCFALPSFATEKTMCRQSACPSMTPACDRCTSEFGPRHKQIPHRTQASDVGLSTCLDRNRLGGRASQTSTGRVDSCALRGAKNRVRPSCVSRRVRLMSQCPV